MRFDRQSGVFLHHTSLPSPHGVGDLGAGARTFVDFLERADQSLWQFCPIGPTADAQANSPYQSYSAFAGNPLLVDLRELGEYGLLTDAELDPPDAASPHETNYEAVRPYKHERLRSAFERFEAGEGDADPDAFESFREREAAWLDDYALFSALREEFDGRLWTEWPEPVRRRDPDALSDRRESLAGEIRYHEFCQWWFDRQWRALREYASERGVRLVGDLPIYVALDSADVWATPEAFQLTDDRRPAAVAGVPPNPGDDGQRWGNPLYDWETLADDGYDWWLARLERLFDLVDMTRLDHFTGFDRYWAIPADSDDPADGEWREGPGADFFEAVRDRLGDLPFLAEDLGFLDQSVVALREEFDFPGMRVPHYADWCEGGNMHQPMTYPDDCVGYTSTHDTNTIVGYYRNLSERQRDCLHYNLGTDGSEIHWDIVEAVWNSNAALAVTTVQDLLGLGGDARFNTPGTAAGNWRWRVTESGLDPEVADRLQQITDLTLR
ncbi:4-alpha-glucanotransferase [Candidatus Halobonum tyrrellensis]|uniref:4-alpha-glucanotransferase n=1 Tax=Candidatus Halobonum tyrrellensis G22 TaxID=1324957 RepID=V4GSP9_9EURY|nr:4-alpha-glucanotransferase [Candidatus Halobonum tyrrellensis]ESP88121.1 4-alpha-glucanotransferase [Candidatus Halobonum tyrrellensis G22]